MAVENEFDADGVDDGKDFDRSKPLSEIVDTLDEVASGEAVTVGDVLDQLGVSSLGAFLMVPALVVVTPLSGVPGLSSVCGVLIVLTGVQMLLMRRSLYLPDRLRGLSVSSDKMNSAVGWMRKPARWIDRLVQPRLTLLAAPPVSWVGVLICVLCGMAMPVVELVPFGSSILGATVMMLALGMLARDGLLMMLALLPTAFGGMLFAGLFFGGD